MKIIGLRTIRFLHWIVILYGVSACLSKNGPDVLTTDRAIRLLALDTGKIWLRTTLQVDGDNQDLLDCELQNQYSFSFIDESDTLFYIGANPNCSQISADTLNRWSWEVVGNIKEEFLDSLALSDESGEVSIRRIIELTSNNLSWEFIQGSSEFRETFKWQKEPTN